MSRLSLADTDWPDADVALWASLTAPPVPLEEPGALGHLRESSLQSMRASYSRWLGWLEKYQTEALDEDPVNRATLERLTAWSQSLAHLASVSRLSHLAQVIRILSSAAPEADWTAARRLLSNPRYLASSTQSKRKIGRVLSSKILFSAGMDAIAEAEGDPSSRGAARRRDGMMIAFLAVLPIRRRAFAALTLGQSIQRETQSLRINLDATLMKYGDYWEATIPPLVTRPLLRYLDETRPVLEAKSSESTARLWLNDGGRPYSDAWLTYHIGDVTERLLGVRITPHLFRDAAATTLAHFSPEAARLSRALLGHTTFGTVEKHYNQAKGIEVGRSHAAIIERLADATERDQHEPPPRLTRKRK